MDTKKVIQLGSLLFTKDEIDIILKPEESIKDFDEAIKVGKLNSEFVIRKALLNKAKSGDNNALLQWNILKEKVKSGRG